MSGKGLIQTVTELSRHHELRVIEIEIDPHLEMAEIQRRVYARGGPALLFKHVKGSPFPCLGNLYGTRARTRFLFRSSLEKLERIMRLPAHPWAALQQPLQHIALLPFMANALPRTVSTGPVLAHQTTLSQLPQLVSWPKDGGAYITLPQVYSEDPNHQGWRHSNLGMYRIQISGKSFLPDRECGFHYQLHRGIGVHHHAALQKGEPLQVSIFVGGNPAHALAAVMPLPEGIPEIAFAGLLGNEPFKLIRRKGHVISADADFCIVGHVKPNQRLPEGPFGDHLGYYSLAHDFPVLTVEAIYHRDDAIWPFTVVGRPPQEDSHFSELIHELTRESVGFALPGIKAVHAVEAAGVHPLLLVMGSERYVPYEDRKPRELLTQAHAVLGFGQLSLAKFLFIAAQEDAPELSIRDVRGFIRHLLERVDWRRDLHFITQTTIDTLDYSGGALNEGSKLILAAAGQVRRSLAHELPAGLADALPSTFPAVKYVTPGVVVVASPRYQNRAQGQADLKHLAMALESYALAFAPKKESTENPFEILAGCPLWVLVDDIEFATASFENWLWVTFTRCNPAADSEGVGVSVEGKHWGCQGPFILDARIKPWHAPVLESDPQVIKRVEALAAKHGPLAGLF